MMTEDEAKTKWCPFARSMLDHGGNRLAYGGDGTEAAPGDMEQFGREMADAHPCIGSACMAWRWSNEEPARAAVRSDQIEKWEQAGWSVQKAGTEESVMTLPPSGYCGLAGKPT